MDNKSTVKPIVFGKLDSTRIGKIQSAGATQTMLALKYKDKKGNLSERIVEPYKLVGNDLWAYDSEKEGIRRFKIKNLKSVKSTNQKYEARWPIEIGDNDMIKTSEFIDYVFEKQAANKVTKMLGNLTPSNASKVFDKIPVNNNIHNKINAKAKKMAGGIYPKTQMNTKKYMKATDISGIPSAAPINTNRILKNQGRENSKVVRELRKQTGGNASVNRVEERALDGSSKLRWKTDSGKPSAWDISIPKKNAVAEGVSKSSSRELRGLTARHEISGEATSQSRMLRALKSEGFGTDSTNFGALKFNNHQSPDILNGDAKMVNRLSPQTQDRFAKKNRDNITNSSNRNYNGGAQMNESEAMNMLRKKRTSIGPGDAKDISTPYFKRPSVTKSEEKEMLMNAGRLNLGFNDNIDKNLERVTKSYQNTPFKVK